MLKTSLYSLVWVWVSMALVVGNVWSLDEPLRIGVTLHPYYSWVTRIVGDRAEVIPVLPENSDPHAYQPVPEDLEKLSALNAIVINGLGHDEFIEPMLKAAGQETIATINPNAEVPLIAVEHKRYDVAGAGADAEVVNAYNSHSFLSITSAVQQINAIAAELGGLDPAHESIYKENARRYTKELRQLLADALVKLDQQGDVSQVTIATVHDGYAYLFQELGLEIAAVIQPRHGIDPSPKQLTDTIRQLQAADVDILFAETDYDKNFVDVIREETGTQIFQLTHVSRGSYTPEKFTDEMANNLDNIIAALEEVL